MPPARSEKPAGLSRGTLWPFAEYAVQGAKNCADVVVRQVVVNGLSVTFRLDKAIEAKASEVLRD